MADREHITLGYVNTEIGGETSMYLLGLTSGTILTSHSTATQWIRSASARVDSALINAGYDPPASSAPALVKDATLGQYLMRAYGRHNARVPEQWIGQANMADAIRRGDVPVPGLSVRNARDAVGGVRFSKSDKKNKPNVMGSLRKNY